ncbi:MAG: zinc metalloprotease [Planctomycetota bacterium]
MEPKAPSENRRQCGTMAAHHRLCETVPAYRDSRAAMERRTRELIATGCMMREKRLLFRIQVVVHALYREPSQRISAAQVRSQLQVLNRDFRLKNANRRTIPRPWRGLAADAGVEFQLASVDPLGRPTKGITYTQIERASFGTGDSVKNPESGGVEPWDTRRYLNIWVAPLTGGLLGYAQFPGGPEATDGVVISYTSFGLRGTTVAPFHRGRTATHEIGHYLNLYHLWGDMQDCGGTDHCCDTPPQQFPNYGKPSFPKISCENGPHGDMFMNYMDYSDDEVMALFTEAQAARIVATMTGPRASLDPSPMPLG